MLPIEYEGGGGLTSLVAFTVSFQMRKLSDFVRPCFFILRCTYSSDNSANKEATCLAAIMAATDPVWSGLFYKQIYD